jgi:hypothetical protein
LHVENLEQGQEFFEVRERARALPFLYHICVYPIFFIPPNFFLNHEDSNPSGSRPEFSSFNKPSCFPVVFSEEPHSQPHLQFTGSCMQVSRARFSEMEKSVDVQNARGRR